MDYQNCIIPNLNVILWSAPKDLTKPHKKVKSGDLSIMHVRNVMPINTHVTNKGFIGSFSSDLRERIKGSNFN